MEETMIIKRKDNGENQLIKASRFNSEYHELIEQEQEQKKKEEQEKFICDKCGKEFKNANGLKSHKKFCEK